MAETQSAEQRFEQAMNNKHLKVEGQVTGEGFCWHAAHAADDFVTGYLTYQDTAWLDQGVKYFDWLVGLMAEAPDGYQGWIGPFIYEKSVWCDVHVGDAILVNPMLRFSEVILKDHGLKAKYGEAAEKYVSLAKKHLIEKWDARGTWREDGPYGSYASWNQYLEPGDLSQWRDKDIKKSTLSLPFNKQFDMGIASLRLWRITGEISYRGRAERIFRLMKSRMQLVDDHLVWNYWEPTGVWDVEGNDLRHWVNVHPYRNYQAGELGNIVEAYHSGIVFDRTDIERMINTNMKVMWNGDLDDPLWRNSNANGEWEAPEPPPEGRKGRAGTLWSALHGFDETVRMLHEKRLKPETLAYDYFHTVEKANAVGFDREYVGEKDVDVFDVSYSDCADLTMVAVLPVVFKQSETVTLTSKAAVGGTFEIAIYNDKGERLVGLYDNTMMGGTDGMKGIFTMSWDGTNAMGKPVRAGRYLVRWTLNGAYREVPVWFE
ncbi:MAG: hypothetical protein HN521_06285 [Candidatus Latescibacteria bacterium]|nr:hypothetical protein [Candidatus Latescibacterota bacterium]